MIFKVPSNPNHSMNTLNPHRAAAFLVSAKSSSPEAGPHPHACPALGRDAQGAWLSLQPCRQKTAPTHHSCRATIHGNTGIQLGSHRVSLQFLCKVVVVGLSSEPRATAVPKSPERQHQPGWGWGNLDVVLLVLLLR